MIEFTANSVDIFGFSIYYYGMILMSGVAAAAFLASAEARRRGEDVEFRSCVEADSSARMYVIDGQYEKALEEVKYLLDRGYTEPAFIRFCRQNALCG